MQINELKRPHDHSVRFTEVVREDSAYIVSTVQLDGSFSEPSTQFLSGISDLLWGTKSHGWETMVFKGDGKGRIENHADLYAEHHRSEKKARTRHDAIVQLMAQNAVKLEPYRSEVYTRSK